jgi:hypothetical protein
MGDYDEALAPNYTDDEEFLARFPDALDEAVKFVFYGKSEYRTWHILHGKPVNGIRCQDEIYTSEGEDRSFTVDKAYSYYFELDDEAAVEISLNSAVVKTVSHPAQSGERTFTAFKGEIPGADGSPATITFKGGKLYNFKNVALYKVPFSSADRIPAFAVWMPHAKQSGLYQIKRVYLAGGDPIDYRDAGENILIRYDTVGDICVESAYFPDTITSASADNTAIDVPTENEAIIVDKVCMILSQKKQSYQDYLDNVDQAMQNLDNRPTTATARVVKIVDI